MRDEQRPKMRRSEALFIAMCAGTIAFVIAFMLPFFAPQSIAWYYPIERRWAYELRPTGLAVDFYGRVLLGLAGASIAVVLSIVVARRFRSLGERLRSLLIAWTATLVVLAAGYFAWTLSLRIPTPVPIPTGYQPR